MNREPENDRRRRLLNDVMGGESFAEFNDAVRDQALGALRRGRWNRHAGRAVLMTMSLAAVALVAFLHAHTAQKTGAQLMRTATEAPAPGRESPKFDSITDEQLVSYFPSNSCYIAEVAGKKMLIFHDPEVEKRYMY